MNAPETGTTPVPERTARSFFTNEVIAILAVGVALAVFIDTTTARIEDRFDATIARSDARFENFLNEAAADRRALQASMDEFRRQMQRLGERQARLEGGRDSQTNPATPN
ncbi:MAG: hypothetical protein OYH76_09065 [Defluviicoccus sp.]|nr:hypothetical protein [Defluviicoccus sp.]MDE0276033.1 hypothetical protein [Defluviicoccus sp.]